MGFTLIIALFSI